MEFSKVNLVLIYLATVVQVTWSLTFNYSPFADWGYDGDSAPERWSQVYPTCGGRHQSPVNIESAKVVDKQFPKLALTNFASNPLDFVIVNNGHTAQVSVVTEFVPLISSGPLAAKYQLIQYHFHWGDNDTVGSENTIDGRKFPLEMHMVFWNQNYANYSEAIQHSDGLTVLALLFEISKLDNPAFKFLDVLGEVVVADTETEFKKPPNLKELLPKKMEEYYTLQGSLTTPPCSEIVTWIIVRSPVPISSRQLQKFRALQNDAAVEIRHNYRPVQPLNGRVIYHNANERKGK